MRTYIQNYIVTFVAFAPASAASMAPQPPRTAPSKVSAQVPSRPQSHVSASVGAMPQNQAWWQHGLVPNSYASYHPRESGRGG